MKLLIEENPYHGDILELSNDLVNPDVLFLNRKWLDNYNNGKCFGVFNLFMFIIRNKNSVEQVFFNTLEKPKSMLVCFLCIVMGIKFSFIAHNFDAFMKFNFPETLKKNLFRVFGGRFALSLALEVYVLTQPVYKYISSNYKGENLKKLPLSNKWNTKNLPKTTTQEPYAVSLGVVDYKRRDYGALINLVCSESFVFKIALLGDIQKEDGPSFLRLLKSKGLEDKFVTFNGFIPQEEFVSLVDLSPLIIDHSRDDKYSRIKASSTQIMAEMLNKSAFNIE